MSLKQLELRQLIEIIIIEIEKQLKINAKTSILFFDKSNLEAFFENGENDKKNFDIIDIDNFNCENPLPESLIIVGLPIAYVPKIALGICDDKVTNLINIMLLNGKKVSVSQCSFNCLNGDKITIGLVNLYKNYIKTIVSFGIDILSLDKSDVLNHQNNLVVKKFDKNVLTKQDIIEFSAYGKIHVENHVIVTDLAKETARKINVEIVKNVL